MIFESVSSSVWNINVYRKQMNFMFRVGHYPQDISLDLCKNFKTWEHLISKTLLVPSTLEKGCPNCTCQGRVSDTGEQNLLNSQSAVAAVTTCQPIQCTVLNFFTSSMQCHERRENNSGKKACEAASKLQHHLSR